MKNIFGFDLGTNSIGWSVVNEDDAKLVASGVLIFQEGVNISKGKEESRNKTRRDARQIRRQYFRRKLRRKHLTAILQAEGLMPTDPEAIRTWFTLNPYQYRALGVRHKIELYELGRALFHLSQRRGFKSNRKMANSDDGTLYKGKRETSTLGITATQQGIGAEFATLGEYLCSLNPHEERVRNRYTTRDMYIDEFEILFTEQQRHYPQQLTNELKVRLGDPTLGVIFYQRPLRSQKHLIGRCTLEPQKSRCPISAIAFEKFRAYQFINSILVEGLPLSDEQRTALFAFLATKDKNVDFFEVKKKLKIENLKTNYKGEKEGKGNDKAPGCYTIAQLTKIFGDKRWNSFSEREQEDIWHNIFFAQDNSWLLNLAQSRWMLTEKQLAQLQQVSLKQDYASLSKKAISNILPFLQRGYLYNEAVVLGGIRNAWGFTLSPDGRERLSRFEALPLADQEHVIDVVNELCSRKNSKGALLGLIREFLSQEYQLTDTQLGKLYHHSQIEVGAGTEEFLQPIKNLRNPIVQKALAELRKLFNQLVVAFGRPDAVKVELARELKMAKEDRLNIKRRNDIREQRRLTAANELKANNVDSSPDNIERYLLWDELKNEAGVAYCPYTYKPISFTELFGPSNRWQIEHIVPLSVSLDNSFANKTLCDALVNQQKGNKTPYEYFGADEAVWDEVVSRTYKLLPYPKAKRFCKKSHEQLDDFIQRQLNDTRYISREAHAIFSRVCPNVSIGQGTLTATLRRMWGLNGILGVTGEKNRDDHRHHAVDAVVVACTKPYYLNQLSQVYANRAYNQPRMDFPLPWEGFRNDVRSSVGKILVSFSVRNRTITRLPGRVRKEIYKDGKRRTVWVRTDGIAARGALHADTIYGRHLSVSGEVFYHYRKPLSYIDSKAKVDKIVDAAVRAQVQNRLLELGVDITRDYTIPKNVFMQVDANGALQPLLFRRNADGKPYPVKFVRLRERSTSKVQLKADVNQWVEPDNNHHAAIYEDDKGQLFDTVVSFWDVVERCKQGLPPVAADLPNATLKTYFQQNDTFIIGLYNDDISWDNPNRELLASHLYRVQKISKGDYSFRKHTASTIDNKEELVRIRSMKGWLENNPIKVEVDTLGNIKPL